MAKLSKKIIGEINRISVVSEIVEAREGRKIGGTHWLNTPPDMWDDDERRLFDLANDIEMKFREKLFEILGITHP